ncbi:LIPASE CLASS 3 FAMILY PROTEIN [Salix koriyanagi]|uniref:LIPASE CLASS 3 FAMILY PROTEIN n=1 Tax=Salix koriyanagi TaxID=2511006 RepID=A0A9Q0WLC4_9ROSI|nr:LIPASE CLASS 3 FAMILY PROTEIN [Salix koriyanagi]
MATAAGAVVLLYYIIIRRLAAAKGGDLSKSRSGRRIPRRPVQAPATWLETISTLSETLRFTYSETIGKWPIGDLAFGINYLLRRQGNLQVASVYAGSNSVLLKGPDIIAELYDLLRLLTLCMYFSKKPFPVFLELAGFSQEDVVIQKPKAGLLKPAFTIIHDRTSKYFLLLIRGTHSIKDTLTAATGAVVPFHHSVLHDGGISNLVLGYAHCGMVAAARWIAKLISPCLLKALGEYPDHKIKIVGHSLGGGTAALLTYILREQKEFSSSTCVTFAPAACMTWDLAESGKHFITTVINGSDLVPTFSAASVDDLRSEVTASSWLNDLRDQVEHTRVLNVVYRSATALGSRLPSIASAKARVAGAGALLLPVSSSTQVVMKRAQDVAQAVVRTRSSLTSWSCIGPRRRSVGPSINSNSEDLPEGTLLSVNSEVRATEFQTKDSVQIKHESNARSGSGHEDTDEDEPLLSDNRVMASSVIEEVTEGQFWYELERELQRQDSEADIQAQEEEAAAAIEIIEEENVLANAAEAKDPITSEDLSESQLLYPPGRIMHVVSLSSSDTTNLELDGPAEHIGLYETPRELYSKIRLSRTMINDHYMPMYKKMMELVIQELENDEDCSCVVLED